MTEIEKLRAEWKKFPEHPVFKRDNIMEIFLKKREQMENVNETIPETPFCYLCGKKEGHLLRIVHDGCLLSACPGCTCKYEDVKNMHAEDLVLSDLGLITLEPLGPDIEFNTSFYDDYE